jgi:hypothetical protein
MSRAGAVNERYQSDNVEMAEGSGGDIWKPYDELTKPGLGPAAAKAAPESGGAGLQTGEDPVMFEVRPPIGLTSARLRRLAAALEPTYVQVRDSRGRMDRLNGSRTIG